MAHLRQAFQYSAPTSVEPNTRPRSACLASDRYRRSAASWLRSSEYSLPFATLPKLRRHALLVLPKSDPNELRSNPRLPCLTEINFRPQRSSRGAWIVFLRQIRLRTGPP